MNEIHGYSSPLNLGHRLLEGLFETSNLIVQEKIDGSQFSFGMRDGEIYCKSRRQMIDLDAPGMFALGVETVKGLAERGLLVEGHTYRGEYLSKPKHNSLAYDRVPKGNIILFDIDRGNQDYVTQDDISFCALHMGLESVPWWSMPAGTDMEKITQWCNRDSILGGGSIEGLVFKNYDKFGDDHKVMMGKYVTDTFKEVHRKDWRKRNPGTNQFMVDLIGQYATKARWAKARQHLQEIGEISGEMQDIPALIKEVNLDVLAECEEEISKALFKYHWKALSKGLAKGLPEWYKEVLAEEVME